MGNSVRQRGRQLNTRLACDGDCCWLQHPTPVAMRELAQPRAEIPQINDAREKNSY